MYFKRITDTDFLKRVLLIFGILCLNKLGFYVTGGEEQYLALAKQWVNPQWIAGSFTLTEPAGTRVLFQLLTGPVMMALDFVQAAFLLRLVNFALLAVPLALIFEKLRCNFFETFGLTQFLMVGPQCFLAGEWIFNNVEPKSFAYIFVLYALYYLIDRKPTPALVMLAVATWFHLLVGGWLFVAIALTSIIFGGWRSYIRPATLYTLLVLPLATYVAYGYFMSTPPDTDVNLDWVYVYYRLPNHLGIFKNFDYFLNEHAIGVIATIMALFLSWRYLYKQYNHQLAIKNQQFISSLLLTMLSIHLLFVIIALADHVFFENSGGLLLKTYPFRTSSVAYLLFLFLGYVYVRERLAPERARQWGRILVILLVVAGIVSTLANVRRSIDSYRDPAFDEMALYIKEHTAPEAVVAIPGDVGVMGVSFIRKAEREQFVVYKFVPYQKDKLLEWYERLQAMERLEEDWGQLPEVVEEYEIDYLLSREKHEVQGVEMVYRNGGYWLYGVE